MSSKNDVVDVEPIHVEPTIMGVEAAKKQEGSEMRM